MNGGSVLVCEVTLKPSIMCVVRQILEHGRLVL